MHAMLHGWDTVLDHFHPVFTSAIGKGLGYGLGIGGAVGFFCLSLIVGLLCKFARHAVCNAVLQGPANERRSESAQSVSSPPPTSVEDTSTPQDQPLPLEVIPNNPNDEEPPEFLPPPGTDREDRLPLIIYMAAEQ